MTRCPWLARPPHRRSTPSREAPSRAGAVAEAVGPSVVTISADVQQGVGEVGTGVMSSADGEILTNAHVVAASEIRVRLPGETEPTEAEVVGVDVGNDLALLRSTPTTSRRPSSPRRPRSSSATRWSPSGSPSTSTATRRSRSGSCRRSTARSSPRMGRPRRPDPDRCGDLLGQLRRPARRRRRPHRRHQHRGGPQRLRDGGDQRRLRHLRRRGRVGARRPAEATATGSRAEGFLGVTLNERTDGGQERWSPRSTTTRRRRGRDRGRRRGRLGRRRRDRRRAGVIAAIRDHRARRRGRRRRRPRRRGADLRRHPRRTRRRLTAQRAKPAGCGRLAAPLASPPCAWGCPRHGTEHFATDVRVRLAAAARDRTATTHRMLRRSSTAEHLHAERHRRSGAM